MADMHTNEPDEEMTVDLELDDGRNVTCEVITVLEVEGKDYIALLPQTEDNGSDEDAEVWFYGLKESSDDPSKEPELVYIEDDSVYEKVTDAFDEYLDSVDYDSLSSDDPE